QPHFLSGLLLIGGAALLFGAPSRLWTLLARSLQHLLQPRWRGALALFVVSGLALLAALYFHAAEPPRARPTVVAWLVAISLFLLACRKLDQARLNLTPAGTTPADVAWDRRDVWWLAATTVLALA